ncbi:MAG TPA: hypothetical protein VIL90_10825 [Puia sp.]
MQKFLVTILALIYLSSSTGAVLHLHYCMGKLVSIGLTDKDGNNCMTCGMAKKSGNAGLVTAKIGCCQDKHLQITTDKNQKLVQPESQASKFLPEASCGYFQLLQNLNLLSITIQYPNSNAPPKGKVPIFLLNHNFRI